MSLDMVLQRIVRWHRQNAPPGTFRLAKGASEQHLVSAEKALGSPLPKDLREFYQLHNGSRGTWLLFYGALMPLRGVLRMWRRYRQWQRVDGYGDGSAWEPCAIFGPIKPYWWGPLRIPITDGGAGNPVMADLDPAKGGRRGQIIKFHHELGPQQVMAGNFAAWLGGIAKDLETGRFVYIAEAETVAPPGMYD